MVEILMQKHFASFRPIDEAGEENLKGIAHGEVVKITLTRHRNLKFLRLFFGLLQLVQANTEQFKSVEQLLVAVKIGIGHCDYMSFRGELVPLPKSISFAEMDEDSFRLFWNKAVDLVIAEIMPVDRADLEREVFLMIGIDLDGRH